MIRHALAMFVSLPVILGLVCGCGDGNNGGNTDTGTETGSDTGSDSDTETDTGPYYPEEDCKELGLPQVAFIAADESTALYATAADFTVPTTSGDWTLSENWSGCDTYLVIPDQPNQVSAGFGVDMWSLQGDVNYMFTRMPLNTRLFFVSDASNADALKASLDTIQETVNTALYALDNDARIWWKNRVHYITVRSGDIDGWLGTILTNPGWGVGIDRKQEIRYIGSFADPYDWNEGVGWFGPNISMAASESIYYNFEADREAAMIQDDDTVVSVFANDNAVEDNFYATIELPDAKTMATFDTMMFDLYLGCIGDGEFGTCPAWDYLVHLYLCDDETPESCTTEIGRWITTYHREGRWVHDVSSMLPYFADGGTKYLSFYSANDYELHLDIRLSTQGFETRAEEVIPLWSGTTEFNATYNDAFEEMVVAIPADAVQVELATVITGHGMAMPGNCAEFCTSEHHFIVNGNDHLLQNPDAGSNFGCQDQVADGTVPNQYGTWWYGRNGWCPGMEVPIIRTDITSEVTLGADNTFDYEAFYMGSPYEPDNWSNIRLASYVVVYR